MSINGIRLGLFIFLIGGQKNSRNHNSKDYIDEEPGVKESGAENLVIQSNYSLFHFGVGEGMDALRDSIGDCPMKYHRECKSINLEEYAEGRKEEEIA